MQLLADIRKVFEERHSEKIFSEELVKALSGIETSPWAEINKGKTISTNGVARLLKPFQIFPKSIRDGEKTGNGYDLQQFAEAFSTYLPPVSPEIDRHNVTRQYPRGSEGLLSNVTEPPCDGLKNEVSSSVHAGCDVVTDEKPEYGDGPDTGWLEICQPSPQRS